MSRMVVKSASFEGANELITALMVLTEFACDQVGDWTPVGVESAGFALQGYAVLVKNLDEYAIDTPKQPLPSADGDKSALDAANARADALEKERDEALDRANELEGYQEKISTEFEKDCWVAMRSLLTECHYDWRDAEMDGVQADEAREYISTTITEIERSETRQRARAEAAESRLAKAVEAIRPLATIRDQALSQTAKLIDKRFDDLAPIALTITKGQMLALVGVLAEISPRDEVK